MSVYFDHAATTPLLKVSRNAMLGALEVVGNPSSIHSDGRRARQLLEESREQLAASIGCDPIEVIFTGGGTESVNLAIKGIFLAAREAGKKRILAPLGEHHATIDSLNWLEKNEGAIVEWLPLDEFGRVAPWLVEEKLAEFDDWALFTVIWANNEVGTIQPIAELAAIANRFSVPVHADAVSAFKHLPIDFDSSGLAALSISAHKIGGPQGMGALILDRKAVARPLIHGGGQERDLRSGTQNVAGAAAFAAAAASDIPDLRPLRDRLIAGVLEAVPEAVLTGDPTERLDSNAHFLFPGCQGDSLVYLLDERGISASTGSACQAGVPEVSHVLLGMGLDEESASGALRLTLGHSSTVQDVEALIRAIPEVFEKARKAGLSNRDVGLNL
ncbi:MAG: cysteine desulfurase [Cryobacterium sp.]|nr:cysteine desulfurase [Cryobacterium sp.]